MSNARAPRNRGPVAVALFGIVALLVFSGVALARAPPPAVSPGLSGVATYLPCAGPLEPTAYAGTLRVDGGPLPPAAAGGVALNLSYEEEVNVTSVQNASEFSLTCVTVNVTAAALTNADGQFRGTILPAANGCGPFNCTYYYAPFGPVSVSPETRPAGYGLSTSGSGTAFRLVWVAGLASLTLSPSGASIAFAPGSNRTLTATPETANGTTSPLAAQFNWTVAGTGWSLVSGGTSAAATIHADAGAGAGTAAVQAKATAGNNSFVTPTRTVNLTSVATTLENGSIGAPTVDVGATEAVSVEALGAPGYAYSAEIDPGLGAPNESVNCSVAVVSETAASVDCSAGLAYSTPGTTPIAVTVTNGYSPAAWSSPLVTVVPAPALSAEPARPFGYPGVPLSIDLSAANGTGVPPYALACFASGVAPASCSTSGGPYWTFGTTYPSIGNFTALAWAIDATGTNRSISLPVSIVPPLALGPVLSSRAPLEAGVASNLSTTVAGGALPAEIWWNASDLAEPIQYGPIGSDGSLSVPFVPPAMGPVTLSVTVRDALGVREIGERNLTVGPGPAARLALVPTGTAPSVVVGHPVRLVGSAYDTVGDPVPTFNASADLVLETSQGTAASAWANVSGLGALAPAPEASFAIPSSAWKNGTLALNLTPAVAGDLLVRLEGTGLPGPPVATSVASLADADHLRLYAPYFAHRGAAVNRTYWNVSDRFGDPVPGAYLTVQYQGPEGLSNTVLEVGWSSPTTTGLWVNYSWPNATSGSVRLVDAAGDVLAGPTSLAPTAVAGTALAPLALVTLSVGLVAGGGSAGWVARRRRPPSIRVPPSEEEETRRFAEGREGVLEVVRAAGAADLATITSAWDPDPPPADLDDWLRSLTADGSLTSETRADGTVAYAIAPRPPEGGLPQVTLDPEALERAVAARDAAVTTDDDATT